MPLRSSQAIIETLLEKRSPRAIGGWQKRVFQLFETQVVYGKQGKQTHSGLIPIDSILSVTIVQNKGKGRRFDITLDGRKFQLLAPTADKCSEWVEHIQKLVENARAAGKQPVRRETKKFWKLNGKSVDDSSLETADSLMTTGSSGAFAPLTPDPNHDASYSAMRMSASRNSSSRGSSHMQTHSSSFNSKTSRSSSTFLNNIHSGAHPPLMPGNGGGVAAAGNNGGHVQSPALANPVHTPTSATAASPMSSHHGIGVGVGHPPPQSTAYSDPTHPHHQQHPHAHQQHPPHQQPPHPHLDPSHLPPNERAFMEEQPYNGGGGGVPGGPRMVATTPFEELKSNDAVHSMHDLTIEDEVASGVFGTITVVQEQVSGDSALMQSARRGSVNYESARKIMDLLQRMDSPYVMRQFRRLEQDGEIRALYTYPLAAELFGYLLTMRQFPFGTTQLYAAEVLHSVEYFHSQDIIFTNLGPEQIFLDSEGHVHISDFLLGTQVETAEQYSGVLEYTPPEFIKHKTNDKVSDWWRLGILIYEFCAGLPPIRGGQETAETNPDTIKNAVFEQIVDDSFQIKFPPFATAETIDLVQRLLQRNPEQRLGAHGGAAEIKAHPFFKGVDWQALHERRLPAPQCIIEEIRKRESEVDSNTYYNQQQQHPQ